MNETLEREFMAFYVSKGYETLPAEPLVPRNDKSVLFTNSTFITIKPRLLSNAVPEIGWLVSQPCIRLQNLRKVFLPGSMPAYMSVFHMLGVFIPPHAIHEGIAHIVEVLHLIGAPVEKLSLVSHTRDADLVDLVRGKATLPVNWKKDGYFNWQYGIPGWFGRGIHFLVNAPQQTESFGQLVAVYNGQRLVGYEFGFGVETFRARRDGLLSPFSTLPLLEEVGGDGERQRNYVDLVLSSMVLTGLGLRPGHNALHAEMRRILNGLTAMRLISGWNMEELHAHLRSYGCHAKMPEAVSIATQVCKNVAVIEARWMEGYGRLLEYRKNQLSLSASKRLTPEEAVRRIVTYERERSGVPEILFQLKILI